MFDCQLCQQESNIEATIGGSDANQQKQNQFANISELEAHLASEHFNCLPYECEQCHFAKFPTEFAVIKHNEEDHGNKCYSFRCRITPSLKQKRAQVRAYLLKIKKQHNLPLTPVKKNSNDIDNCSNLKAQTDEKCEQNDQQKGEYSEEVNGRNKLKPLSNDLYKKKTTTLNNGLTAINNSVNEDMGCFDDDFTVLNKTSSSLTEQLQAACAQNIRHRRAENEKSGKTSPNYGGTIKIREGEELPTNILLGKSTASTGNTTDEENEELEDMENDFVDSEMNVYEDDQEEEDNGEQARQQEADVQEILKATAVATSQVSGGDAVPRKTSTPYSLRPNRFPPYAALHEGKQQQQQQSSTHQQQQKRQNWQIKLGNSTFSSGGGSSSNNSTNLSLLMNSRERVVKRIRCRKCGELVNSTGGCLMHHLNTRHLRFPLFRCRECKKDFYEVSNTRIHKHMRISHGGDRSNLISNYSKYSHSLHQERDKCFGTREERLREIQRERGLCTSLNLDGNDIDFSSIISNVVGGKTTNNNNSGFVSRFPLSSPNCANNNKKVDEFLRPSISFKQFGSSSKQQIDSNETQVDQSPHLSGPFNQDTEDLLNEKIKKEFCGETGEINIKINNNKKSKNFNQLNEEELDEGTFLNNLFNKEKELNLLQQQNNSNNKGITEKQQIIENNKILENNKNLLNGEGTSTTDLNIKNNNRNNRTILSKQQFALQSQQQYQMMHMQLGVEEKVACKVCGEMVLNKTLNRHNHVNTRHLHLPLHQCRLCQKSFTSYSRSACYSHVQFAHRADLDSGLFSQNIEEHIIYMKEQYNDQLTEAANDYFD